MNILDIKKFTEKMGEHNLENLLASVLAVTLFDPKFRVMVAAGLTDVQTPYLATALELAQIPEFGASGRLTLEVYPGGHMVYADDASRRALRDDARRLIEGK